MIYSFFILLLVGFIVYSVRKKSGYEIDLSESKKIDNDEKKKLSSEEVKWEIVQRKSKRWFELGFGDGEEFPGYGQLYNRVFEVWYCNVGSKEKLGKTIYKDIHPLHYHPKNSEKITGENVYTDKLTNSKEYDLLFTALDSKNRKRWYFALIEYSPTGIQTESIK